MMCDQHMDTAPEAAGRETPIPGAGKAEPAEVTGTIKTYRPDKGFGFISRYGAADVFFHASNLAPPEALPEVGQRVRFARVPSKRKPGTPAAVNVRPEGAPAGDAESQRDG